MNFENFLCACSKSLFKFSRKLYEKLTIWDMSIESVTTIELLIGVISSLFDR